MSDRQLAFNLARIVHRLLTDSRGWRTDVLISELGIKDRTYRKYRKILTEQFEPFLSDDGTSLVREVSDGESKYLRLVYGKDFMISDHSFVSRIAALYFAQQLLGFVGQTPIGVASSDILADFKARIRERKHLVDDVLSNVDRMFFQLPDAPKDYSNKQDVIRELLSCLIFRRAVKLRYSSAAFAEISIEVEPYTLAVYRSALYLIGRGIDEEIRIYAVDRILSVEKTKRRFTYPPVGTYSPETYTEGSFGIFRSDSSQQIEFELIFKDERWLKLYVRERRWHPTQRFEDLEDGRLRMTFRVNTDVEVWPWIRQFGENVEVISPPK